MNKMLSDMLKPFGLVALILLPMMTSCASIEPGTVNDPGQALDAPTEPESADDTYSEGLQYPEEQDNQE